MKILVALVFLLSTLWTMGQGKNIEGFEVGFDGSVGTSNLGGSFGIGPKFGFLMNENLILGPTLRFQRSWATPLYTNSGYSYNNFGGGFFLHARYKNTIYGGFEAEFLRNKNVYIDTSATFKKIVPTLFVCGGFSREFGGFVRLNVGIYYDLINSLNSPFRNSYILTVKDPQTGAIVKRLPMIYRISFFFPIGKKQKAPPQEIEESYDED
jgi:hypothetical protein